MIRLKLVKNIDGGTELWPMQIELKGLTSHQAAQAICAHYDSLNIGIYIFLYDDLLEVCEQVSRQKTIYKKIDQDWVQQ